MKRPSKLVPFVSSVLRFRLKIKIKDADTGEKAILVGALRTPEDKMFSFHKEMSREIKLLASQTVPTWNQIISWLNEMRTLRQTVA
jgi:hypothetical protein